MEKNHQKSMDAQTLSALSVVCLHTTMPLVNKQAQEIKDLKAKLKRSNQLYCKLVDEYLEIQDWLSSYSYDEDFDRERMDNGEEPIFRSREEYEEEDN